MQPQPLTVGQLIRRARESFPKQTQQELADAVTRRLGQKVTKNMVTKIEGDNRELSFQEAVAFADALSINLNSMADDLYHNDPLELMQEAWSLLDKHGFDLMNLSTGHTLKRLREIEERIVTSKSDDEAAEKFLTLVPKIAAQIQKADVQTASASMLYQSATQQLGKLQLPASDEGFDINEIEGYDPETGEFDDGSA